MTSPRLRVSACALFLLAALCITLHHSDARGQMAVGINLAQPTYWTRAWVWKDQMRQAGWLESNQWHLVQWGHKHYPAGRWVCEWTGDDAPKFVRGVAQIDEILPGLATIEVGIPNNGIAIQPFGDVQDIRLWAPGVNRSGSPFHPEYVKSLQGFNVLRFMDWQATNRSTLVDWGDRRFMQEHAQWGANETRGVALEYCLELANQVGADPWLCIPHLATDDFVLQMSKLIDAHLGTGRVCYLEWGNEICWNGAYGFNGGAWLQAKGKTEGFRPVDYYGGRVKRINEIARPILGSRLKLVVAGQANNPWIAQKECEAAGAGNFDAVSCTWYFGLPKGFVGDETTTVEEVLGWCAEDVNGRMTERLKSHATIAAGYNVPLVLYEGGQHLSVKASSPIADEVLAAQRHTLMGDLYRIALQRCREAGVTLAVAFNDVGPSSSTGSWGAREHMTDHAAPKWRALTQR